MANECSERQAQQCGLCKGYGHTEDICANRITQEFSKVNINKPFGRGGGKINRPEQNKPQQNRPEQNRPQQNRTQQNRPQQNRPQQNRPQQNRYEQNSPQQNRHEQNRYEQNSPQQNRYEQNRYEQNRPQQNRLQQNRPEQNWPQQNRYEQNRYEQNISEQNRPEQNKPQQMRYDQNNSSNNNIRNRHDGDEDNTDVPKIKEIYIPPEFGDIENRVSIHRNGVNYDKYKNINPKMSGKNLPLKLMSFEEANINEAVYANMTRLSYYEPTPIQACALPAISQERDIMACATTGSGKTAAFLIPVMTALLNEGFMLKSYCPIQEPLVLIISPTKELAIQIYEDILQLAHQTAIHPALVYGGVSIDHQVSKLKEGCHIVVATPGRLLHFLKMKKLSLNKLKFLILDEADTMLDMNFMGDIKDMVNNFDMTPKQNRQTLMFSATFPESIQLLAQEFLNKNYIHITVGILGGASPDVIQHIIKIEKRDKINKLEELLQEFGDSKVLIFVSAKKFADFLASLLSQRGFNATTIHGDRLQREREEALTSFKNNSCNILIATDVLARGHDIKDLEYVVVYDIPRNIDTYVHRIGRTGRLGNIGNAYTFFTPSFDSENARPLVKVLGEADQVVPIWLEEIASHSYGTSFNDVEQYRDSWNSEANEQFNENECDDDNWD